MNSTKNLTEFLKEYKNDPEFLAEEIILDIMEKVSTIMERKKITKAELAKKLDTSKAYITKLLSGNPNITILTLAKLTIALEENIITIPIHEEKINFQILEEADTSFGWRVYKPTEFPVINLEETDASRAKDYHANALLVGTFGKNNTYYRSDLA